MRQKERSFSRAGQADGVMCWALVGTTFEATANRACLGSLLTASTGRIAPRSAPTTYHGEVSEVVCARHDLKDVPPFSPCLDSRRHVTWNSLWRAANQRGLVLLFQPLNRAGKCGSRSRPPTLARGIEYPPTIFSTTRHHLRKTHFPKHLVTPPPPPTTQQHSDKMAEQPNDAQVSRPRTPTPTHLGAAPLHALRPWSIVTY